MFSFCAQLDSGDDVDGETYVFGEVGGRKRKRQRTSVDASVSKDATGECTSETGINDRAGALREICAGFLAQVACGCHQSPSRSRYTDINLAMSASFALYTSTERTHPLLTLPIFLFINRNMECITLAPRNGNSFTQHLSLFPHTNRLRHFVRIETNQLKYLRNVPFFKHELIYFL